MSVFPFRRSFISLYYIYRDISGKSVLCEHPFENFLIPCKKTLLIISRAFLYRELPAHGHANSTSFITLSTLSLLRLHMVFSSSLFSQGFTYVSPHFRGDIQRIHGLVYV